MTTFATRILRTLSAVLLAGSLTFAAGRANAQVSPNWDHFHVYTVQPHPTTTRHVTLIDQFGATNHAIFSLNYFANPVTKLHGAESYPIVHPDLHYTWWSFEAPTPVSRDVIATNQFGQETLHLYEIAYLLCPAVTGPQPLPIANHYKVYRCTGPGVNIPVTLFDQFQNRNAVVGFPRYFCVPADKKVLETNEFYPLVDVNQHYTVYEIDPLQGVFSAVVRDQFLLPAPTLTFTSSVMLMVPTDKDLPTPAQSQTWGRLKALYR